jgi:hypothetical protein
LHPDTAATAWKPPTKAFQQQQEQQRRRQHRTALLHHQHQQQQRLQHQLGYTFSDPDLLSQALTHVSHFGLVSYQLLEFLGDSVLDLLVSLWLMQQVAQHVNAAADGHDSADGCQAMTSSRSVLPPVGYILTQD